jgi:hypothetical protein
LPECEPFVFVNWRNQGNNEELNIQELENQYQQLKVINTEDGKEKKL